MPLLPLGPFAGSVAPVVLRAPDGSLRLVLHGSRGAERPAPERGALDLPAAGRDARVAIGLAGEVVAAWTQGGRLLIAVAPPGGAFGAPVELAPSGSPRQPMVAAGADGRVLVAWLAAASGRTAVEAASRAPDGTFGATIPLVAPDARAPVLAAASNGELLLAYLDASGPTRAGHVGTDRASCGCSACGRTARRSAGRCASAGPSERTIGAGLAVKPSGTQVVWPTTSSVRARRVAPGGRRGRVFVLSSLGVDGAAVPAVAGGVAGGAVAAWVSRGRVVMVRSLPAG